MSKKATETTQPKVAIAPNSQLTIKIAWKQVEPVYQKVLQKVSQNVKADGFRKGKVPLQMVESMVDSTKVREEVLQQLLPAAYTDALKAEKKLPISQPEIEPVQMEKGKDWEVIVYFAERPEVKLGKYADAVKKATKTAAEEIKTVEKELKEKAKNKKDEPKDEGHQHDQAHDHDHDHDHSSQATELSDQRKEDIQMKHIFKNLIESIEPKIPELLVRQEVNREIQRLVDQLNQLGLAPQEYLKSRQMTEEQLQQEYMGYALSSLQIEFILAEIAKEQKITVEDKEIDETLDKVGNGSLTPEQRKNPDYRSYLFSTLIKQKVMKHLLSL